MTKVRIKEDGSIYEIQCCGEVSQGKHRIRIGKIIDEIRKYYDDPSSGFWEPFQNIFLDAMYGKELEVISCDFVFPEKKEGVRY